MKVGFVSSLVCLPKIRNERRKNIRNKYDIMQFCQYCISDQRNWVFATNLNVLIPISLQPDDVNLWQFQTKIIGPNKIHSLRFTTLRCKDIGIRKSEFVAKTWFLKANKNFALPPTLPRLKGYCFILFIHTYIYKQNRSIILSFFSETHFIK